MTGRLLVISGPSGSGKSSIVRALRDTLDIDYSVSATTRSPRPGEIDGVHYRFIERAEFEELIRHDSLLEWAEYNNNYYGTPNAAVEKSLEAGRDVLLEIEIQGARQIRERRPDALMFFIIPPSLDELERRLRARGDTSTADIRERLERAAEELAEAPGLYDHVVENDDLTDAIRRMVDLVTDPTSTTL